VDTSEDPQVPTVTLVITAEDAKEISDALDELTNVYLENGVQTDDLDKWVEANDKLAGVVKNATQMATEDPMCECLHRFGWHQTGDGPWTGFCYGTLAEIDPQYWLGTKPEPNLSEPCACEGFRKLVES
jgi:hypothetical protein